jgi:hypothetical protein
MDFVDAAACNMARVPRAIVGGARAQTKAGPGLTHACIAAICFVS